MDISASHLGYVIAAYGLSALCIAGLCWFVIGRDRALQKQRDGQS
jgi:heme exporter protein CcmD